MTTYFVTQADGRTFYGRFTLAEITSLYTNRKLPGKYLVTESDSRSFDAFVRNNSARWRTVSALLAESPRVDAPVRPHRAQLSDHIASGATLPRVVLVTAALLSVVGSFASPLIVLASMTKGTFLIVAFICGAWICMGSAFAILCGRAIAMESVVLDQDAENRRLWAAIEALRAAATIAKPDTSTH